jgi:hypothetical protein
VRSVIADADTGHHRSSESISSERMMSRIMIAMAVGASAQHIGNARDETHLALPTQHCTVADGCDAVD